MYEFIWRFTFFRQACLFKVIVWYIWACFILHTWTTKGDEILAIQTCVVGISAYRYVYFVVISITTRENQKKRGGRAPKNPTLAM